LLGSSSPGPLPTLRPVHLTPQFHIRCTFAAIGPAWPVPLAELLRLTLAQSGRSPAGLTPLAAGRPVRLPNAGRTILQARPSPPVAGPLPSSWVALSSASWPILLLGLSSEFPDYTIPLPRLLSSASLPVRPSSVTRALPRPFPLLSRSKSTSTVTWPEPDDSPLPFIRGSRRRCPRTTTSSARAAALTGELLRIATDGLLLSFQKPRPEDVPRLPSTRARRFKPPRTTRRAPCTVTRLDPAHSPCTRGLPGTHMGPCVLQHSTAGIKDRHCNQDI